MSTPNWITPAGSLGVVPEGIFFQYNLLASTVPLTNQPIVSTSSATTDTFTCTSTAGMYAGLNVTFDGTGFGGANTYTLYFIFRVVSSTEFQICTTEFSTTPIALTTDTGYMKAILTQHVYYNLQAGALPTGIQISDSGAIVGIPVAAASLQGIPSQVAQDVTSKFTIRAYTYNRVNNQIIVEAIRERTFTLTITGNDVPEFVTPAGSLGTYYDGDELDIQIDFTNDDPGETAFVRLAAGELPGGITLSADGLISGYIQPAVNVDETAGYDNTSQDLLPYDFIVSAQSKNYQFTLEVTDGKSSNLRTFFFYVYDRATMTADVTTITADTTTVTADQTNERKPFLTNASPSNLGIVRGDNYYAYQFIGNDYDTADIKYAIAVNEGAGLPPGLTLDPVSGYYYGYVPDQGVTEVEYSFNVTVYQSDFVGDPITCTATTFGTNYITCNSTAQIGVGQPIVFTGTAFGGITASPTLVYYVFSVVNNTTFTVTTLLGSATPATVSNGAGTMTANLVVASDPYPFLITISGAVDAEVNWTTPADLGIIDNGDTSLLKIEAINRGGRELLYRLKSGAFNELPQGLELLPTGEISGRVTFNTFAVDLGYTTFDNDATTWDLTFRFTVNAYAEDLEQIVYEVDSVTVVNGGSGYSTINLPVIEFSTPIGAAAVQAQVGNVLIGNVFPSTTGPITTVEVSNKGSGYSGPAIITIVEAFGGSGANLVPVMKATGVRDVVSVNKNFVLKVKRAYNEPYQNLIIQAMPPNNDRVLIQDLLTNDTIFVPEYIFRPDDPFFGKSTRVDYNHAYGLAPDTLDRYTESLFKNHYWKNLVLGQIETAQALDPVTGEVVYEVVYSKIIDNLTNNQGQSVSQILNLAYPIIDPADGSTVLTQVYPNSLFDMRNQVIDVVGQISTKLPLWMTSKQTDGRVLGFTPAWVICYTNPGRSRQISYYIQSQFGEQLNRVDFKVDRYILDRTLSRNWDTETQSWTPTPSLTTFDRFNTAGYNFLGTVDIATNLAYADVNQRTLQYINDLGGLDGEISNINGNTLIFVKQENYDGPPGSQYSTADEAWQDYIYPYDSVGYSQDGESFDESETVPDGTDFTCTATSSINNTITCASTNGLRVGQEIVFTSGVIGGIVINQTYYVYDVVSGSQFKITATEGGSVLTLTTAAGTMLAVPANERMAVYQISVDPLTTQVTLTLLDQTVEFDYVQVTRGSFYRSAQVYYPSSPAAGLSKISWVPLITITSTETTFDEGSMAFEIPVDMYDPTDRNDKYLVFPKANILV
jgi:hypothetical protein